MVEENVKLTNVYIAFRNFSGSPTDFDKAGGKRTLSIYLPKPVADQLEEAGWHIRHKPPRREGDDPINQLDISFSYQHYPPMIKLIASDGTETIMSEETVGLLDSVDIKKADLEIRPYNYDFNGRKGTSAKVHELTIWARPPRRALNASMFTQVEDEEDDTPF